MTSRRSIPLFTALLALVSTASLAQTGVGDDRVSLPDGPGSRDGMGDNASVNPNMGQMSTSVDIDVPGGFAGVTPSVGLSYSSGAGNSVVGLGWSMSMPFIERMTSRGYPDYDADDRFVANGSEQLVRVSANATTAVYRARFEGGFVRYSWFDRGAGDEGYWTAEYPDGLVATFGASADGTPVAEARVGTPSSSPGQRRGVFRYLLTSMVDRFGHEAIYDYQVYGTTSLLDQISYVFTNGTPRYRIGFDYEERQDIQSDARGGFLEEISDRLSAVNVVSGNTRISRYVLDYEAYAAAGGSSRLQRVQRFGKDGGLFPVVQSFEYSKALGGVCDDSDGRNCRAPYLVDMGALGVNLQSRTANLIDMNGDSLPDIVDTQNAGQPMRIFLNELHADGSQEFGGPANSAVLTDSSGFALDSAKVQMLDVNGDGFVDLVNQQVGKFLVNRGAGDWDSLQSLTDTANTAPDFADFNVGQDGDLPNVRFLDADGDRRIDVLRTQATSTEIFLNNGDGSYSVLDGVMPMGDGGDGNTWDFASTSNLELADMNGDGLLDPVRILSGGLQYQLNLGFGQWSAIQTISDLPFTEQNDVDALELEDINGDGIDDIVVVRGSTVRFAINRNGKTFDAVTTIAGVGNQSLPERLATTTVLYADMNGNGSNDIVWITGSGGVTFLELFPVRPNLLTKIENGLGLVTEVTYGTAAEQRAQATDPATQWPDPIPTQMIVVTSLETYAQSSDPTAVQHDVMHYSYEAGFYDGEEKQFRGFSRVTQTNEGDDQLLSAESVTLYDTGDGVDRAQMAGLLLQTTMIESGAPLMTESRIYELCPVADLPATGLEFPIRFVCQQSTESVLQRGAPSSEWATTRIEYDYDGYGNQTRVAALGVTQIGDGGCPAIDRDPAVFGAPAGPDCLGDERYVETDFIPPDRTDGAWMLDIPRERRTYGRPGSAVVDTMRFFYDGRAFVGLSGDGAGPLATDGLVTRVAVQRTIGGAFEDTMRNAYDAHGNVVDTMNALGTLDGRAHHTRYAFDDDHLSMVSTTKTVASLDGDYDLKSIVEYDPLFEGVARMTRDFIVGAAGDDTSTVMAYDEFGRVTKVAAQGDSLESPSETYTYDYGNPSSKLTGRRSSVAGGESDLETVECTDGFGRTTQRAVRVAEGRYTVSGAALYNRRGAAVRRYLAFDATAADVCKTPPADVTFDEIAYTSTGEELAVVHPDGGLHGGVPSRLSRRYRPLSVEVFDEDDSDVASATKDTPGVMHLDGMGRVVAFERTLTAGGPPERITITYDELGNLRGFLDPEGNEKAQTYDLTGRLLRVVDPERGTSTFSYDADSRVVRSVAGNGRATASEYDSLGRLVAQFDEAAPESSRVEYYFDKHPTCLPSTCTNGAGQLVGVRYPLGNDEAGVDAYGYDVRGQLVHSSRQLAGQTFEFTLRYDNADRVAEQVFPGGQRLRYAYDGADRLVAIEGYIDEATYTSAGQISQIRYSNGTVDKRTYDDALRPLRIETLLGNGDTAVSLEYVRNRRGKITAVHDNGVGRGAGINEARFAYDGNERLSQATLGRADTADVETIDYQYSVLDNLLGKSSSRGADSGEHVPEIAYDAVRPHAVRQAGDVTSVLDDAGLVVSRGARTFGYDGFQRLTSVHRGEEELARYAFDVTDARVLSVEQGAKVYSPAANFEVRDGVSRLRFGATQDHTVEVRSAALQLDVLSDRSGSGNIDAADAFAATVDPAASDSTASIDELLRGSARRLLLGDAGSQTRFFAVDQAGSVVGVTDEAGQLTERIAYQPHGNVRTATAGRTENVRFAGHEVDAATGLINMGSRFYDPNDGHFLSPDPEHDTFRGVSLETMLDASNSYGYAGQDPVNAIDPTGRMIVGLAAGFTGAIATAAAANIAGAFLGGGVAVAVIMATVAAKGGWSEMSTKAKVGTVLMGIGSVALGTVSGFLTAGLSAVGDAIQGAAEVAITAGNTLEHPLATPGNKLLLRLGASSLAAANALLLSPGALLKAVFTGSVALLKPLGRYVVEVAPGAFKRWGNRRAQAAAAKASEGASRAIEQRNRTAASERAQGWFMNNERHAKLIARRAAKAQAAPKPGRIQRLLGRGK